MSAAAGAPSDIDDTVATLREVAQNKPLAHPTAFGLRYMDYDYAPPHHLVEIDQAAYEALDPDEYPNRIKNIARLMPREHGKSEDVSHKIPSWLAMRNPNVRILIMMESADQAAGKLEQCAETIRRHGHKHGVTIKEDAHKKLKLHREANHPEPTITAAGFETSITGGHYDLIIFDDLVSQDSMGTEHRREKAWTKFQDYLNLGTEGKTVFLVAGTRKHPEDIYDKLMKSSGWDVNVEKAISDFSIVENGEYTVITGAGERFAAGDKPRDANVARVIPHRDVPVLWPERWPLSSLIKKYIEGTIETDEGEDEEAMSGSRVWIRENQNKADALMGQVLSRDMLEFVDGLPESFRRNWADLYNYAGMDLALEQDPEKAAANDTDYFSIAITAYDPRNGTYYVRDIKRKRGMSMKQAIEWADDTLDSYPSVNNLYIESNQAQRFFVQEAADRGMYVKEVENTGKKEDRIITMSARFENKNAVVVGNPNSPKYQSFISEWTQFPSGDHDDRLDAVQISMTARAMAEENKKNTATKPFMGGTL